MIHKKAKVLLSTYCIAAVAVLGGFAIQNSAEAAWYQAKLTYTYQRAYTDLNDSIATIGDTLEKSLYANTATQQNGLASRLMRETSAAKAALATLPISDDSMNNVSKFIAQVGDFAMSLSKRVSAGGSITKEEYSSMRELSSYAQKLQGNLSNTSIVQMDFSTTAFTENMKTTAEDFSDYPTLIYDGPFSDHIQQKKPSGLEGMKEVAQGNAQLTAAEFLGIQRDQLSHTEDTAGNLPTRNFTGENAWISVSKYGGKVISFLISQDVGEETLEYEEVAKAASAFLESRGIKGMKESYYAVNDGRCTINYAYTKDDVIFYSDLIKVTVAMDTGDILEYNAAGYWMNHHDRNVPSPKISEAEARKKLSPLLKAEKGKLAMIPTGGLNEVLTWEFKCTAEDGKHLLVYINCETGFEEQIYILTYSDNGILVR